MQFEKKLAELETIVEQLDKGDISLEEALKGYEKGIKIAQDCQSMLKSAEQKVELLSSQSQSPNGESDAT